MKTIGTVINTIVVVFGMLCSLIAGTFVGYCLAVENEKPRTMRHRQYTSYSSAYPGYNAGYDKGWNECKKAYGDVWNDKEEESEDNEDIGET